LSIDKMFPAKLVFSGSFWTLIPEHYQGQNQFDDG